jgi:hypothetical protein
MPRRFRLNHLVLHYIGFRLVSPGDGSRSGREKWQRQAGDVQDIDALDDAIEGHLLDLIQDVWDSPDAGAVYSARFDDTYAGTERALVRGYIAEMQAQVLAKTPGDAQARGRFLALSQAINDRLFACTTLAASPGLLMVADVSLADTGGRYLALLKVRHTDERFVTILQDSLTDLGVQDVEMMLTREVLKGIIWPHPTRLDYDLKLVDHQARYRHEPALYFARDFLGCQAKQTDAYQAARLPHDLPEDLAREHGVDLDADRTDAFVAALIARTAPTAATVAALSLRTGLIPGVDEQELEEAIAQRLSGQLPVVASAEELESGLQALAHELGWDYEPARRHDFRLQVEQALRLNERQLAEALVETGLLAEAGAQNLIDSMVRAGGVEISRQALLMRTKTQRRLLRYRFEVPRLPNSPDFVEITVSGPPETVQRFLHRENGGNYVFVIESSPASFAREYG